MDLNPLTQTLTYDIQFDDNTSSMSKGFELKTIEAARRYIRQHNGTGNSYFRDFAGGVVSIVDSTGETVESVVIINKR
jgi:hypothetical protein